MYKMLFFLTAVLLLSACDGVETPANLEPRLYVGGAVGVTRTEATVTGGIIMYGDTPVPELRFVYGADGRMDMSSPAVEADGEGRVSYRLTGLTAGTEYSFRLHGDNGRVTLGSDTCVFTTVPNDPPTVTGLSLLSQGPTSVIVEYGIVSDGGEAVTATGCRIRDVASGDTLRVAASGNVGDTYRVRIGGLRRHASYEIRPYAANAVGETVGGALSLVTGDAVVLAVAGELAELIGDDVYGFTSLSLAGPVNGDDLCLLRRMMGRAPDGSATEGVLVHVNMTDAHIVGGGGSYGASRYTEDDVIGYGLFAGCDRLEDVALPSSAKVIEKDAFLGCVSLERIDIPADIVEVAPSSGCYGLQAVEASPANERYKSVDGVLFNAGVTEITWFPMGKGGDYSLPETVTSVGDYAFRECNITRFTLPSGLEKMGQGAFYGSKVEEVVMPARLRLIPTGAFQACRALRAVRLGAGTELISDYAFDGCPLEHLYVEAAYPPVCDDDAFSTSYDGLFSNCVLHVPSARLGMYKADGTWGMFDNITGM